MKTKTLILLVALTITACGREQVSLSESFPSDAIASVEEPSDEEPALCSTALQRLAL